MWKNHLKIAWRNLLLHRTISLINLSGLTIGMTAAFFMFLWVKNELSYDSYHSDAEHIYRLKIYHNISQTETWVLETSPLPLGEEVKKQLPEVQIIARLLPMSYQPPTISINDHYFKERNAAYVDENWFRLFHFDFIEGSAKAFNSQLYSVVLSESNANKFFGNENALGKTIRIDTIDYQIQGVIKDYPANSSFRYGMFLSFNAQKMDYDWGSFSCLTFLKIMPAAKPKEVAEKVQTIFASNQETNNTKMGLTPLKEMHFEHDILNSQITHGNRKMVNNFMILGVLLLGIASVNYVNLTTARATTRIKEVSVRKIVGAQRKHLFIQFLAESALLSFFALLASLLLVKLCLPAFNHLTESQFLLSFGDISLWQVLFGTFVGNLA